MATGTRALTLKLLADVDNFNKNLKSADTEVTTFGGKVSEFGKKAGLAFAAAGAAAAAYAGKLAIDGVKAAIEDEAAQLRLATSLRNVTGATDAQIAATEAYILKTSLAKGVTDDVLRPSLDRLVRSTKDVEEAQKLQSIALDISAGTGRDLGSVTEALSKAYDGNFGALKRIGVSLDEDIIKSKDFDAATLVLSETFGGQAATQAETYEGKLARLSVAFNEGKETVGAYILDAVTPLVENIVDKVIPAFDNIATTIGEDVGPVFKTFFETIKTVFTPILDGLRKVFTSIKNAVMANKDEFAALMPIFKDIVSFVKNFLAPVFGTTLKVAFGILAAGITPLVTAFGKVANLIGNAYNSLKGFISLVKNNPLVRGISGAIENIFGGGRAAGGPVTRGTTYLVGERGPELFTPGSSGNIIPNNRLSMAGVGGGGIINITVNGAIDSESTARQIVSILNNSQARGTLGAGAIFP
jgi:hypothetical protein